VWLQNIANKWVTCKILITNGIACQEGLKIGSEAIFSPLLLSIAGGVELVRHAIVVVWLGDLRFPGLTAWLTEHLQLMVAKTARPPALWRARSRAGWLAAG
jgi:hypothetical protein